MHVGGPHGGMWEGGIGLPYFWALVALASLVLSLPPLPYAGCHGPTVTPCSGALGSLPLQEDDQPGRGAAPTRSLSPGRLCYLKALGSQTEGHPDPLRNEPSVLPNRPGKVCMPNIRKAGTQSPADMASLLMP